jgi:hypothetical protein
MPALATTRWAAWRRQRRRRSASRLGAPGRGPLLGILGALLLCAAGAATAWPQADPLGEYQLKAAFLLNFAKFIEWPANPARDEKTPVAVCIFRFDPYGGALDEMVRGKQINNREVAVRRVNEFSDLKGCQMVFLSSREDHLLPEALTSLQGSSALVVGESDGFAERGGGIQFYLENNRLRFAVNVDALQRAQLNVSSKLLALARIVHDADRSRGR